MLEPAERAAEQLDKPRSAAVLPPTVYRLADAAWPARQRLYDEVVTSDEHAVDPAGSAAKPFAETAELRSAAHLPLDRGRRLDIGIVADTEFVADHGEAAEASLLSMMNIVDGIYISQLGIQLRVTELELFSEEPDPFERDDGLSLLGEMEDYKASTDPMRAAGLAHLFTGRELESPDTSERRQVGIANLGVLCSAEHGVALTAAIHDDETENALIAAHEIGHNFGAPHDAETGSACESAPYGGLMTGEITGSEEFSDCSIEQMRPEIEAAECLEELEPNDLSLRVIDASDSLAYEDEGFLVLAVEGNGLVDGAAVQVSFEAEGSVETDAIFERTEQDWSCPSWEPPKHCTINYFPIDSTAEIEVELIPVDTGAGTLHVSVHSANDPNPDNNAISYELTVEDAADVATAVEARDARPVDGKSGFVLREGEQASFTATISNAGPSPASGVEAEVAVDEEFAIDVVPSSGTCRYDAELAVHTCGIDSLDVGAEHSLDIVVHASESIEHESGKLSGSLNVKSVANEPDPWIGNGSEWVYIDAGRALVDLMPEAEAPQDFEIDSSVELVAMIRNAGPDTARDVAVSVSGVGAVLDNIRVDEVSVEQGSCSITSDDQDIRCEIGALPGGSGVELIVRGVAAYLGAYSVRMDLYSDGYELRSFNDISRP